MDSNVQAIEPGSAGNLDAKAWRIDDIWQVRCHLTYKTEEQELSSGKGWSIYSAKRGQGYWFSHIR